MSKLLILDINGVLCYKIPISKLDNRSDYKNKTNIHKSYEYIKLNKYYVIFRPGYREFLNYCYANYTVAFFSSTKEQNASKILEYMLNDRQKQATLFFWFRDRTRFDYENMNTYSTVKLLQDVFDNPIINENMYYNQYNTIIIDDSYDKTRYNHPDNVIICDAFEINDVRNTSADEQLLLLINIIEGKFKLFID